MGTIDDKLFTQMDEAKQLAAGCFILSEFNDELDDLFKTLSSEETEKNYNEVRRQFAYWLNSAIKLLQKERAYLIRNYLENVKSDRDIVNKIHMCTNEPLKALGLAASFHKQLNLKRKNGRDILKQYLHTMKQITIYIHKLQIAEQTAYKYTLNNDIDGLINCIKQTQDNLDSEIVRLKKNSNQLLSDYKEFLLNCFETWVQTNALKINQIINQNIINCWNYRYSNVYAQPNLKRHNKILVERMSDMAITIYNEKSGIMYEAWEDWINKHLYDLVEIEKDFADRFLEIINYLLSEYLKLNLSGIYKALPEIKAEIDGKIKDIDKQIKWLQAIEDNYQQLLEQILSVNTEI